jgi:hypothetical protein
LNVESSRALLLALLAPGSFIGDWEFDVGRSVFSAKLISVEDTPGTRRN